MKARRNSLAFPLYRNVRFNHLYTQHQHLVLLMLRQWMGKSYREFCEWVRDVHSGTEAPRDGQNASFHDAA